MQVNQALSRLGQPPEVYETPTERVSQLSRVVPPAEGPAHVLLGEYQAATYSQHSADEGIAHRAGKEIRKLSYQVIFRRWLARYQEPPQRRPLKEH
jgi:hypothetical protein